MLFVIPLLIRHPAAVAGEVKLLSKPLNLLLHVWLLIKASKSFLCYVMKWVLYSIPLQETPGINYELIRVIK